MDSAQRPARLAFSVDEFCAAHDLSRASFYLLLKAGRGPRLMRVGRRVLVSAESASEWRARMEEPRAAAA